MGTLIWYLLAFFVLVSPSVAKGAEEERFARAGSFELLGSGPHYLDLAAGVYDFDNAHTTFAVRGEVRGGRKLGFIGPAAGFLLTAEGSVLGYLGAYADIAVQRLLITPLFAVGAFHAGEGKDLGYGLEFRSAITFAYRLSGGSRLGVQLAHVSNADLADENPGQNDILLSFAIPF